MNIFFIVVKAQKIDEGESIYEVFMLLFHGELEWCTSWIKSI